jgi:acetyl-CoA carboxylase biotin carboxyl carrier protein
MDINVLKKLIKVVENSNITEFSIQEGDLKVKISKNSRSAYLTTPETQVQASVQPVQTIVPPSSSVEQPTTPATQEKTSEEVSNLYEVKSPIVGTFYRAPAPDADVYVQVGDTINEGSVLCIVEAMKLMNEIESDVSGKIVKVLVENATPVEYNQPLFLIQTD